jgi:Ca-activated chloride channel family protein
VTFRWPLLLLLLLALPALAALYVAAERRRSTAARAFVRPAMRPNLVRRGPGWRRHVPIALMLVALGLLVVALSRPERALSVERRRATVMLVLDTSRSMHATDIEPSRFTASKQAVWSFVDRLPEQFRVGLVTFGRRPQTLTAPTVDRVAIDTAIAQMELTVNTVLGDGIARGLETLALDRRPEPAVMLLVSDGNDTGSEVGPQQATDLAAEAGVRINVVSMGDPNAPPTSRPRPPNAELLRGIADGTGGRYYSAADAERLSEVYRDLGTRVTRVTEIRELTFAFVGAGGVIALLAGAAGAAWLRRVP